MASSDLPRVQYRPGSGSVVYAVVLALVAPAAFYTQSNLLFVAGGLMIGGLVFTVLWAWLSLRGLRLRRSSPPRVSAGEPLVLRYHLDNHGGLPAFAVILRERPADDPEADGTPGRPPRLGGLPVTWALYVGAGVPPTAAWRLASAGLDRVLKLPLRDHPQDADLRPAWIRVGSAAAVPPGP